MTYPDLTILRGPVRSDVATSFSGARVLITGGAGFIGSNLARRLVFAGARVTLIDSLVPNYGGNLFNLDDIKSQVTLNISDVRDPHALNVLIKDQDYLFNLAGQTSHWDSMEDPFTDLEINAASQLSILESCRRHNPNIRVIYASTRQVYGKPEYLPVDENHPIKPVDVNGINKIAGENYHILYSDVYGLRSTVLRLTNTVGPRMRVKDARQTFVGIWIRNLLEGKPISVYGDGGQLRDFNFVDDVVDAMLLAASTDEAAGEIYNLGASETISLAQLASLLIEVAGFGTSELVPFPPHLKKIDIGSYYGSFEKIRRGLGWEPRVGLLDGLGETIEFYRRSLPHYCETLQ